MDLHYHILNRGLRGLEEAARAAGTRLIGGYTARCGTDPRYLAYSVTGVGFQVQYAIDEMIAGRWSAGYKPFGLAMGPRASDLVVCGEAAAVRAKVGSVKKELLAGRIRVSAG